MTGTRKELESILRERIAVLDGSWGVLIQRELRGEEAYRGERFRNHSHDVAGDPDLLNITRPEVVTNLGEVTVRPVVHDLVGHAEALHGREDGPGVADDDVIPQHLGHLRRASDLGGS